MEDSPDEKEEEEQQLVYVSATPLDDVLSTTEKQDRNSVPTSEDMREQALANLNRAVFVRESVHSKQQQMFNSMVQSLVHEFLETGQERDILRRIDQHLLKTSLRVNSNTEVPALLPERADLHRVPSVLRKNIKEARARLTKIQAESMDELRMLLAETRAQINQGKGVNVQL